VPDLVRDRGDAWEGIDDDAHVGDVTAAIALWDKDVHERGMGELNFPPDYPKMPGEPPRVQPSKRRKDREDSDYLGPKAERDAAWGLPVIPPVSPMLAKPVKAIPEGDYLYEPKWDGFRSIVFRSGDTVEIGSRNEKPMTRYFPEVVEAVRASLPEKCVVDGEIVVIGPAGDRLDFELLQQRIHPAASRVKKLSVETPAHFVAFDLLALGDEDLTGRPFGERRALLEEALKDAETPMLGLHTDDGTLMSVGVIGAFPMARRQELFEELQPLVTTFDEHPWAWAEQEAGTRTPRSSEQSRWAAGKDLSFTPLRPERVVEVRYDHMEGVRFRHTAQFVRWRPDRDPQSCTYEQLEEPVSFDLADVLGTER